MRRKACQGKAPEKEGRQAWVLLEGSAELLVSGFQPQPPSYLATDPSSACLTGPSPCPFSPYPILTSPSAPWHPTYPHRTHRSTGSFPHPKLHPNLSSHLHIISTIPQSPFHPLPHLPTPPDPTLTQTCFLTPTHQPPPPPAASPTFSFLWICILIFRG